MGRENPTWGEERIANELLLQLGIQVSPRTVGKYLPPSLAGKDQRRYIRWSTFLRLHTEGIIAGDFAVVVTATFRWLYVFVVIEHGSRRLIHCNVTAHTTAAWTLQQCAKPLERTTATRTSFTTAIASSPTNWTSPSKISVSMC